MVRLTFLSFFLSFFWDTFTFLFCGTFPLNEDSITSRQAAAEGIKLNHSLVIPRNGINKTTYIERFPLSQGKIPALEGPVVKITETIAICYVSGKPWCRLCAFVGTGLPLLDLGLD